MTDFKPINTQEEFDERIKERLSRAEKKIREEYSGYMSVDDVKILKADHAKEIEKLKASHADELKKYEGYDEKFTAQATKIHELETSALKTKIAMTKKLPMDAIEFLQGDDEKSITESADKLSKLSAPTFNGFTRNTEPKVDTSADSAYRELASVLAKS